MNADHPHPLAHVQRAGRGCLCCGSNDLHAETTVIAPFMAGRALQTEPGLTRIVFCRRCGFRFFDRGLSEAEAARLYDGYRNEAYFLERHASEPFYTRAAHRQISASASPQRRQAVVAALAVAGAPVQFGCVIDFGGGDGGLIADIPAAARAVFDPSGATPIAGVGRVDEEELASRRWALVVCAQVLEHVNDPRTTIEMLAGLLAPQGWLYLEVPDEIWSNRTFAGRARDGWLRWLVGHRGLLIAADTLSTACRILLGFLPPFGFIPMREHLQYFTRAALVAIVRGSGLAVVHAGRNNAGQFCVVATPSPQVPAVTGLEPCTA